MCRAFLSPWYERGGMEPADENDKPVFVGRINLGRLKKNAPLLSDEYCKPREPRNLGCRFNVSVQ